MSSREYTSILGTVEGSSKPYGAYAQGFVCLKDSTTRRESIRRMASSKRRGIVAPVVAITLVVLLGFAALAVDLGYVHVSNAEMQRAADSSALAGASGLLDGDAVVYARVHQFALQNEVAGRSLASATVSTTIGNWNGADRVFTPADGSEPTTPNAVRLSGTRPDVDLFFGRIFGLNSTLLAKRATAVVGSGVCAGLWGLVSVEGAGHLTTDSFDSQVGPYGPGNIRPNGDLCSCEDVDLAGSVTIYGDVMHGIGYSTDISGNAYEIYGILGETNCFAPPPFDIGDAVAVNDNASIGQTDNGRNPFQGAGWDLRLTGTDNLTLQPGTYYFTSVRMTGQATLTVTGPTNIYVSGDADFTGGGVTNVTADPANLTIYSTGSEMKLTGNSGFYGAIIAPGTEVNLIGTTDYYGTIYAEVLDIGGTANIHVDESLLSTLFGLDAVAPILVQ